MKIKSHKIIDFVKLIKMMWCRRCKSKISKTTSVVYCLSCKKTPYCSKKCRKSDQKHRNFCRGKRGKFYLPFIRQIIYGVLLMIALVGIYYAFDLSVFSDLSDTEMIHTYRNEKNNDQNDMIFTGQAEYYALDGSRDISERKIEDFMDWLEKGKFVKFRKKVELKRTKTKGYGFFASEDIEEGEVLFEITNIIPLSDFSRINDPVYIEGIKNSEHLDIGAGAIEYIIYERFVLGEQSFYHPYFEVLPSIDDYSRTIPVCFDAERIKILSESPLSLFYEFGVRRHRELASQILDELLDLNEKYPLKYPKFTLDMVLWSLCTHLSRSVTHDPKKQYKSLEGEGDGYDNQTVLGPPIDFINCGEANSFSRITYRSHGFSDHQVTQVSQKKIRKGDEIIQICSPLPFFMDFALSGVTSRVNREESQAKFSMSLSRNIWISIDNFIDFQALKPITISCKLDSVEMFMDEITQYYRWIVDRESLKDLINGRISYRNFTMYVANFVSMETNEMFIKQTFLDSEGKENPEYLLRDPVRYVVIEDKCLAMELFFKIMVHKIEDQSNFMEKCGRYQWNIMLGKELIMYMVYEIGSLSKFLGDRVKVFKQMCPDS